MMGIQCQTSKTFYSCNKSLRQNIEPDPWVFWPVIPVVIPGDWQFCDSLSVSVNQQFSGCALPLSPSLFFMRSCCTLNKEKTKR